MADNSKIEWTDATWNPLRGCSKVSPGCANCYAMHVAARFHGPGEAYDGLAKRNPVNWTGEVRVIEAKMLEPLHWKKPRRVFVNSMSDLFHETVPDEFIDRVLAVMALCSQHTFQVLTKRAERMCRYMAPMDRYFGDGGPACVMTEIVRAFEESTGRRFLYPHADKVAKPLSNVWLGVSCEDQQRADERIPWLLKTPAAVRFVSAEPLLETVELDLSGVHWVIVGGESGHRARPCNAAWIRDIILQCRSAGVACFVKQLGSEPRPSHAPSDVAVRFLKDKKGGDPAEWPADLRVREFPASPAPLRET